MSTLVLLTNDTISIPNVHRTGNKYLQMGSYNGFVQMECSHGVILSSTCCAK